MHPLWLVVGLVLAFAIPGPCSYDGHAELDCRDGERCPAGLACAADGFCKAEDVACDSFEFDAVLCDGVCLDRAGLEGDPLNCGACGVVCDEGEGCCDGVCEPLDSDEHCGSCAESCGNGQTCAEASCRETCTDDVDCAADTICCGGACVSSGADIHCGTCGVACSADERCVDELCRPTCSVDGECPGAHCCDGTCTVADDPNNCGGCGSTCGADQVCLDDACAPECAPGRDCEGVGETCCGGRCVDLTSDADHCSECDATCPGSEFCFESACHDGTEEDCCGVGCTDCIALNRRCSGSACVSCNMFEQNCDETRSCVPAAAQFPPSGQCRPVAPDPAPGLLDACTPNADDTGCSVGLDCRDANSIVNACMRYCDASDATSCDLDVCAPVIGNFGVCLPSCDPAAGLACAFGATTGTCTPIVSQTGGCVGTTGMCVPAGPLAQGDACTPQEAECGQGLFCNPLNRVCTPLCVFPEATCASGTCQPVPSCGDFGLCSGA